MYYRTIRNDILRNKAITLTTMIFVAAAAMLVSLAAILIINLSGAIDTLMTRAKTPHFMQMHAGEMDTARLVAFVEQNDAIDEFQVLEFLNMDGARIIFEASSLAGSVQDNGFSVQSEKFDYLLDLDGNVINGSDGELYVPISYRQDGSAKVGDKVDVFGKEFTVAGFLRDSQMNSLLASSKRFLVSKNDFAEIRGFGNVEYLIEFRLKEMSALGAFEAAYTSAGLDANGPTITYPLFKTINAISDGLMIAVLLLVSALVVAIAFLCIRFTLIAKIEEDYREIGVMKAIGLRVSDIKKIYLTKYAAIAAAGSMLGFALTIDGHEKNLTVCAIYSDVTNGGKPAKAVFAATSADSMWSVISAELSDKALSGGKTAEYAERFAFAKVSGLDEYILQTYGSTISSVGKASYGTVGVALAITALITLLFMRMLIVKDRYSITVMKAFGFTNSDIMAQFVSRSVFVLIFGIVLGTLLANTLGEALAGAVIAWFGASSFEFVVNPLAAYLICPLLMGLATLSATIIGTLDAGRIKISENIKE